jgi:hypothetical protein
METKQSKYRKDLHVVIQWIFGFLFLSSFIIIICSIIKCNFRIFFENEKLMKFWNFITEQNFVCAALGIATLSSIIFFINLVLYQSYLNDKNKLDQGKLDIINPKICNFCDFTQRRLAENRDTINNLNEKIENLRKANELYTSNDQNPIINDNIAKERKIGELRDQLNQINFELTNCKNDLEFSNTNNNELEDRNNNLIDQINSIHSKIQEIIDQINSPSSTITLKEVIEKLKQLTTTA